jgi:hypothetical protein
MGPRLLVIALVPPADFSRFLREVRARYGDAQIAALIGSPELRGESGPAAADEYMLWGSLPGRALIADVRRRRFDLLTVAYNRDYCHRVTYWKALAVAIASGARGMLFCEQARLPQRVVPPAALGRPWPRAAALLSAVFVRGIPRVIAYLLAESLIALLGSLLVIVLAGIVAADAAEAVARGFRRSGRSRASRRQI